MTIREPNYQGPFGNTLLHGAVLSGDVRRSDSHVEELLDQALEATFPASDPVALAQPGG